MALRRSGHQRIAILGSSKVEIGIARQATTQGRGIAVFKYLDSTIEGVLAVTVIAELGSVLFGVVSRNVLSYSFPWTDEVARFSLVILTFVGGAYAYRRNYLIAVEVLRNRLHPWMRTVCVVTVEWLVLGIGAYLLVSTAPLLSAGWGVRTLVLGVQETWFVVPVSVGAALLCVYSSAELGTFPKRVVLGVGAILVVAVGTILISQPAWQPFMVGQTALQWAILCVLFVGLLALGMPLAFVLVGASTTYLFYTGVAPASVVPQQMEDAVGSFIFLAVPFFILAGLIVTFLGTRLVRFVQALVGGYRGGTLNVVIIAMYLFSGISGSKAADVAAIGSSLSDLTRDTKRGEVAAVLSASAAMGETIPPSIAMLVLGSTTSLSIGALFAAGLLPAAVLAICLMAVAWVRAGPMAGTRQKISRQEVAATLWPALPVLPMPVILIGGIVSGIATPTEVSSFAVAYGVVLSFILARKRAIADLRRAVGQCAAMTGMVLLIVSGANAFTWILAIQGVLQGLSTLVASLGQHGDVWLFVAASIAVFIILGALLEGLPALIILGPLLVPAAAHLGINPVQYGIVLIIAMGIGAFSPPLGVGAYVATLVTRSTLEEVMGPIVPYLAVLIGGLILIAALPWISLSLPNLLHMTTSP
jgi:tripartite ATP-independent transporter DctM subunit